jgi:predicted metalloprotease with PDZ domain
MNRFATAIIMAMISLSSFSQKTTGYQFTIDLVNVAHDKVQVEAIVPAIKQDEIIYYIPKIVPGTYSEDDFGRYVEDFLALDKKGNQLTVERASVNSWKISHAQSLYKIKYKVNDTFDDRDSASKKIFEPCGSNIQQDTNYVINTHCFVGYFDGMKQLPYQLTINHPANMYGTTAVEDEDKSGSADKFTFDYYNRIVDNPIMYAAPDTATIMVGTSKVVIGVYSPNKKISAAFLAENFSKLLQAQAKYLGGVLPVKKYAFLVYLTDHGSLTGGVGALEHSYSSMYFMPEGDPQKILQFFMDVAAHEFFHILTPLSIHSEEIQYFDFNEPKMSKHLWLYEGSTEYHANLMQEKYGLITKDDFLKAMGQKITNSLQFYNDTLPFTVMSEGCLHTYADQYGNVYQKGALIAMCIDIKLRKLSNGKYGILNLVFDLSKKYGKDKPFKDAELFDEIGKLTYPEIKDFLVTYVSGNKPLPLEEELAWAGVDFKKEVETKDSIFTLGKISTTPGASGRPVIGSLATMNEFGKKMGYQLNDELKSINGKEITVENFNKVLADLYKVSKTGDMLTVVVVRKNNSGAAEDVSLSAPMMKLVVKKINQLNFMPDPSTEQLALQNSWLGVNQ